MQLVSIDDVPKENILKTFKNQSWLSLLAVVVVMTGITLIVALPKSEPTNPVLVAIPTLVTLLFAGMLLLRWRECRQKENWLVKLTEGGMYINLRSYRNLHLPRDKHQALFLPKESVTGIGLTRELRYIPDRHRETKDQFSYIDIMLTPDVDLSPVQGVLYEERRLEAPQGWIKRKKYHDYPVRVLQPAGIRLVWDWMRPAENQALEAFGEQYPLVEDRFVKLPRWGDLDKEAQAAWLQQLWEEGHEQDVMWLVRMDQKVGSSRARRYIQEHIANQDPAS